MLSISFSAGEAKKDPCALFSCNGHVVGMLQRGHKPKPHHVRRQALTFTRPPA